MPFSKERRNDRNTAAHDLQYKRSRSKAEDSDSNSSLNDGRNNEPNFAPNKINDQLVFYPAYCYKISPIWFTWVKLTAFDIHHNLQARQGCHGPTEYDSNGQYRDQSLLLFFLNHPIQFVQVTGVVVNVEEFFEKIWVFTIDDSSGATIDVTCRKPNDPKDPSTYHRDDDQTKQMNGETSNNKQENEQSKSLRILNDLIRTRVSVGTVVRAKGTFTTFRQTRQLALERLSIISTTAEEIAQVQARVRYRANVLSKPWTVAQVEQEQLHKTALGESDNIRSRQRRVKERARHREERDSKHTQRIAKKHEQEERQRAAEAEKARIDGEKYGREQTTTQAIETEQTEHEPNLDEDQRTKLLRLLRKR